MKKTKNYHQYTDYDQEPGGLRKLDFIVGFLQDKFAGHNNDKINILDFGCGKGNISLPLASLGYSVLGVDLDRRSIVLAKQTNQFKQAEFIEASLADLDSNRQFSCVIASEVIEHLIEPVKFLKAIKEKMTQAGVLIISVPAGYSLEEMIRRLTTHTQLGRCLKGKIKNIFFKQEKLIQTEAQSPHLHFFTLRRFKKMLHLSGWEIIDVKNSASFFKEIFYLFKNSFAFSKTFFQVSSIFTSFMLVLFLKRRKAINSFCI